MASIPAQKSSLMRRFLNDIEELHEEPYPNIHIHITDSNIRKMCLVLIPGTTKPLHLTVEFTDNYPLQAPSVTIQSVVSHPNVFGNYICASILNTTEGWTSAYTLKAVAIQLLSFFSSDRIEQSYGAQIDLADYHNKGSRDDFICRSCGFGTSNPPRDKSLNLTRLESLAKFSQPAIRHPQSALNHSKPFKLPELPDELWLQIMAYLKTSELITLGDTIPKIRNMQHSFDFIRTTELQCFCLKKSFLETKLGIGVALSHRGRRGFRSEFDLLSEEAFVRHKVRTSIQGIEFQQWLPLALSRRHWNLVRGDFYHSLDVLHKAGGLSGSSNVDVLYSFMTNIVVHFSAESESVGRGQNPRSTLTHASEKAVEAYFSLFHLLLCLATERPGIAHEANGLVDRFLKGPRTKSHFPDLGWLLVASLISDEGLTETLAFEIIREAILRNVVWMLDAKGAGHAELSYIEPEDDSNYRLAKTFGASPTSYRLLMFLKLFSSTARTPGKTIVQLRDELFDSHGAPPPEVSVSMAQRIKHIRGITNFPGFLKEMGIKRMPSKEEFGRFLKRTIADSVTAGYSRMPLSQGQAVLLRRDYEPNVRVSLDLRVGREEETWYDSTSVLPTFFPEERVSNSRGPSARRGRGYGRRGGPPRRAARRGRGGLSG